MGHKNYSHGRFTPHPVNGNMLSISRSLACLVRHTPLYEVDENGNPIVVKPAGIRLTRDQIQGWAPHTVPYLVKKHKPLAVSEIQTAMVDELFVHMADAGDVETAKAAMIMLVEQTFNDPKMLLLKDLCGVTQASLNHFQQKPDLLKAFLMISGKGYGLAEHSVNVMAASMIFAFNALGDQTERYDLCIAALLHDLGRIDLPDHLILPSGELEDDEFALVRRHPKRGVEKLKDKGLAPELLRGIGEHHERVDGTGYPDGLRQVSIMGQILGLADSFDALTGYARPDQGIVRPLDALRQLKEEADQGKFDHFFFTSFAYSLAS